MGRAERGLTEGWVGGGSWLVFSDDCSFKTASVCPCCLFKPWPHLHKKTCWVSQGTRHVSRGPLNVFKLISRKYRKDFLLFTVLLIWGQRTWNSLLLAEEYWSYTEVYSLRLGKLFCPHSGEHFQTRLPTPFPSAVCSHTTTFFLIMCWLLPPEDGGEALGEEERNSGMDWEVTVFKETKSTNCVCPNSSPWEPRVLRGEII